MIFSIDATSSGSSTPCALWSTSTTLILYPCSKTCRIHAVWARQRAGSASSGAVQSERREESEEPFPGPRLELLKVFLEHQRRGREVPVQA